MDLLEQMKRERERRGAGRFFGLYRGVVTNVNDPENLGRVRAKVHELLGDTDETDWAFPCVPFGGGGAGWLMLPKTNDAVWIAFEAGDLSRPVWLGFWFNRTDTPPEGAGPDIRVLRSKAGHRIEFGDAEGEERLRISHPAGTVIEMDADGDVSLIESGGNVKLGSGALKRLVNDTFKALFNQHTHPYQNGTPVYGWAAPPATETQAPSSAMEDSHLTEQTIAS